MLISKAQLQDELNHAKDQLNAAVSQSQEYSRQILDLNQEMASVKEQLRESHAHVRTLHQDRQRLEKQMHGLKSRVSTASSAHEATKEVDVDRGSKSGGGLREFKLNRSKTTPPHPPHHHESEIMPSATTKFSKRLSSLPKSHEAGVPVVTTTAPGPSQSEHEALLAELVQAKTAEAVAKQEAEEARQKLESIRKSHGLSRSVSAHSASASQSGPGGMFGLLSGHGAPTVTDASTKPASPNAGSPGSAASFWGWRR
jgi:chromosome segregation ATPase